MEKVLVIIPTYNEVENIQKVIDLTLKDKAYDILVVDDSSPDGTADLVLELIKTHSNRLFLEQRARKEGLGKAYIHGFRWALENNYDFILRWMPICPMTPKNCLPCWTISNRTMIW